MVVILNYVSFLWDNKERYEEWEKSKEKLNTAYIKDLNLLNIFKKVSSYNKYSHIFFLQEDFLYPCHDINTVKYRLGIFDLLYKNQNILDGCSEYIRGLNEIKGILNSLLKSSNETNQSMLFIEFFNMFLSIIFSFYEYLTETKIDNIAFVNLQKELNKFFNSDYYIKLKEKLEFLIKEKEELLNYSMYLNVANNNAISVTLENKDKKEEETICNKLDKLSSFLFTDYNWEIVLFQNGGNSGFDEAVIDRHKRRNKKFFDEATLFYNEYTKFDIDLFYRLAKELISHITYLNFVKDFESKGFVFSCPSVSDVKNSTEVTQAYDLSLGIKNNDNNQNFSDIVCNDFNFNEKEKMFILAGANQGGKTTFIRSIGIVQFLAQCGFYVPAKAAKIWVVNSIFTHFAQKEKRNNVGRLGEELIKINNIIEETNKPCIILFNEPFTSTRRDVAVYMCRKILEKLIDTDNCIGGLVTHFHELLNFNQIEGIFSCQAETIEGKDDSGIRTYRIIKKAGSEKSYAHDIVLKCGVSYDQLISDINKEDENA